MGMHLKTAFSIKTTGLILQVIALLKKTTDQDDSTVHSMASTMRYSASATPPTQNTMTKPNVTVTLSSTDLPRVARLLYPRHLTNLTVSTGPAADTPALTSTSRRTNLKTGRTCSSGAETESRPNSGVS